MQVEFLIVGQGISGTFLSYYLHKKGKSVLVVDKNDNNSPSRIAAGIINPVTGRRMVTVWMADTVLPFAWSAYQQIGNDIGVNAISQKDIIDFFPNPFMRENFLRRLEEGNQYTRSCERSNSFEEYFKFEFGCGQIHPVYTAHTEVLLPAWRQQLQQTGQLLEEEFDHSQVTLSTENIRYKNIEARYIIFCDGAGGFDNPYFKLLPFAPNKGEALILEVPGLPNDNIYKKSVLLVPIPALGKDLFWAGSNYAWDFEDASPTKEFREATERSLKDWLKLDFKIVEHRCGIRPATLERRPFVGFHPVHKNIGVLNGMGTKGCSLAPYFANELVHHLVDNIPLTPEADIRRFQRILSAT